MNCQPAKKSSSGPILARRCVRCRRRPASSFSDISEHYIQDFFSVFRDLNVEAETYRMRDVYRSGQFNEAIDDILRNAATVRRVYKEVSKSERPDNWYPFQAVCEQCGRIGTTEVTDYDGKEVTYTCRPDLVTWASGCGYQGKVSPFDGKGKLPWKLEWTAKWKTFHITIEGAGKDHTTKGGSRDVAAACLRKIFHQAPPLNIPYEFFLVGGRQDEFVQGAGRFGAGDGGFPAARNPAVRHDPYPAQTAGEFLSGRKIHYQNFQ